MASDIEIVCARARSLVQVKEAGLGVQRAAKQDPSFGVGERAAAAAAKALDPGSGFPEKTLPEVQQAEKHRWEPPQYQVTGQIGCIEGSFHRR